MDAFHPQNDRASHIEALRATLDQWREEGRTLSLRLEELELDEKREGGAAATPASRGQGTKPTPPGGAKEKKENRAHGRSRKTETGEAAPEGGRRKRFYLERKGYITSEEHDYYLGISPARGSVEPLLVGHQWKYGPTFANDEGELISAGAFLEWKGVRPSHEREGRTRLEWIQAYAPERQLALSEQYRQNLYTLPWKVGHWLHCLRLDGFEFTGRVCHVDGRDEGAGLEMCRGVTMGPEKPHLQPQYILMCQAQSVRHLGSIWDVQGAKPWRR